jgi:hypothetical protein
VNHRLFASDSKSWKLLFQEAAEFAASLGREKLISICHSHDSVSGVVAVWYHQGLPDQPGLELNWVKFESYSLSWEKLFLQADAFAGDRPAGSVASISHSCADSSGMVVVWFWGAKGQPGQLTITDVGARGQLSDT